MCPWALIFWLSKIRVFQSCKIFLYLFNWNDIRPIIFDIIKVLKLRHQLCSEMPCTVIWKIFVNQPKGVFGLIFDNFLLVVEPDVFGWSFWRVDLHTFGQLIKQRLNHPKSIIPTMKIAFIHAEHLAAKTKLHHKYLRLLFLAEIVFENKTFLYSPLSLKPKRITFWTCFKSLK